MLRLPSVLLLLAAALAGCRTDASAPASDGPPEAEAAEAAYDLSRIVTLGGPVTETAYALGMGEAIVGTDRSSLYPEAIHAKPRLDYFRQTSAEGVLSLEPTLVVAVEGTGPEGVLEQIRAAGVPVVVVPEAASVEGAEARVREMAALFGRPEAADAVVASMRADLEAVERPAEAPRALFVYARGAGVVLVAGTGEAADAVLRLAGAENVVAAFEGYQPLTAEAVASAAPDVIVIPERSLESLGGVDGLLRQPGLAQTPAGQARRVVAVDDALLLGFGPRVGEGVQALADGLRTASVPS